MEKQDLQNFLLLPLLFLGRLFLTQVSSLTVNHSSTSFTVVLHIKGSGNCKGKYTWELQFSQCFPHTPEQTWFRQLFSVEGFTTCYACMKAGLFCNYHCNIMLLVFKMFYLLKRQTYKLTLYNTLPNRLHRRQMSFPGILTGHTIKDNNNMTKTFTKLLHYISAIRSQQTAGQVAPVCHSKAPCERLTQHHRMSVQVYTQTQQFHGSNILALECSHNFCSPQLTRYQRWLEIPHPPHTGRTSSATKSSALLKALTTTI